ncbi:hypothetical protein FJY68_11525 [candidate division WOR-3 bacterium]|uniref:Uncharacterized protein n=1 Tax=candidate division WOR-3 bacterium TaxID=2052148 RepID=A0A938BQT0_UNCW3|nr:hypothetical protein [candidate division WOR-3 bacterium]
MITRAFYRYSQQHPDWPYPRQIGVCQFKIPPFDCPSGIPACTLYYYQESHSGDADLLFNAWYADVQWPPQPAGYYTIYMAIWNSTDTLATDSTRANDDCWYKVPLRLSACAAIADSGATGDTTVLLTGWVYSGTENGYYTDVSGTYASNPPYIKIVYDD